MKQKIYIIHGWTYDLDKWDVFVDELRDTKFEPILLKVPGLTTKSDKVFTINDYESWLDSELKSATGKIIVMAHSNGGRIALHYIARHPDTIEQLILVDSAGVEAGKKLGLKRKIVAPLAKIARRFVVSPKYRLAVYKFLKATDYHNAPENMKQTMQNMLRADDGFNEKIAKIKTPTLLIWGRHDQLTPLRSGQDMAQLLGAKLHIIDDARHAPFNTHPKDVLQIVEEFLK